jgi:putative transposase
MRDNSRGRHTLTRLTAHLAWGTKYRHRVPEGDITVRYRGLLVQSCDAEGVRTLEGVAGEDRVRVRTEYPPSKSLSDLVKRSKGRTSRRLREEYPALRRRYRGGHFRAIEYGAWGAGNVSETGAREYLEHHRRRSDQGGDSLTLE